MSKYIDSKLLKKLNKQIDSIEIARREVSDDKLAEIMKRVSAFYAEHIDDDQIFFDGKTAYIYVKTWSKPEKEPIPKKNQYTDELTVRISCNWNLGFIGIFVNKEQWQKIGWDKHVWLSGKLTTKFDIMGYPQNYYKTIELACKANNVDIKKITESDIIKSYTLNVYQVIE